MALLIKLRSLNSILGYSKRAFTSHAQMLPRSITANNRQYKLNLHSHHHGVKQSGSFFINTFRFNSIDSRSRVMDGEPLEGTVSTDTTRTKRPGLRTLDRAINLFEERSQRSDRVVEREFVRTFDLFTRVVDNLGQDMGQSSSNLNLYANILLRSCGKLMIDTPPKGRELLAGNLWAFIKEKSIPIDISHYNSLIRVMNENETIFDPKILLDEINSRDLKPDRITYQRLIHQYCLQGDITGATDLLEKMKDSNMEMSEQIFASLILGYSKQEKPPSISEIFTLMRGNGVEPNSSSYTAAFKSIASKIESDPEGLAKFEELASMYEKDDAQFTTNDLIELYVSLCSLRSKYEQIDKFLNDIETPLSGPVSARYKFLTALVRIDQFEQASRLFWSQKISERAMRNGAVGSYWTRALAVNRNVTVDFAVNQCKLLEERKYQKKPLHQLYYTAAESGNLNMVRGVLKVLADSEAFKVHYIWPLIAQAKDQEEIVEVLKRDMNPMMDNNDLLETFSNWIWPKFSENVLQLFELNKELKYDNNVLMASYLNYSVQEGKFLEALKFITEAPHDVVGDINEDTLTQDGLETSSEMSAVPRTARSDRGDLVSRLLNQIVEQTRDAELVKKAFNMCQVPNQPVSSRSLAALVRVHLLNGNHDAALEEFLRISREHHMAPCRSELMKHCLTTKNPEKLQKVMNCVTEIFGEQNSLFDLAVCCLRCNKLKQAQKIFASPGFRVRPVRIYETARTLARQGEVDVLENFVSLARDMYDVNKEYLYQVLIDTYEKTSNPRRALRLYNMMQEEEFQPSRKCLIMIADILEKNDIEVPFQRPKVSFMESGINRRLTERRETSESGQSRLE